MPNTVILMSDEHNPFVSSVYGHPFVRTPNMERLAGRGTVFDSAYCPSPLCVPARSSFMTGKYVHQIQVYGNVVVEAMDGLPTYGQVLDAQGVHTVHVGKVHVYDHPEALGFSEMLLGSPFHPVRQASHGRTPLMINEGSAGRAGGFGPRDDAFQADLDRMEASLEWLRTKAPAMKQPWTLCINLIKPHFPHYVTPDLWEMYEGHDDLPEHSLDAETAKHPYFQDLREHFQIGQFTEEQVRGLRRGYYGCVTFIDRQLGRLIDALDELGLSETTNLVYTTDHGEMLGKFGLWWKCTLLEDSARLPMIAAGPEFAAGKRVKTPVDLLDLQASLFRSTKARRPADWQGVPLQDITPDDSRRFVFSEYHAHGTRSGAFMIRKGDWKLIYYMDGPHQLFNVATGPQELRNLYASEPDKAAELEHDLRSICSPEKENQRAHDFEKWQLDFMDSHRKN